MTFPQFVGKLMAAAFDAYLVDLRLGQATHYRFGRLLGASYAVAPCMIAANAAPGYD
jgi:hypothetical protein